MDGEIPILARVVTCFRQWREIASWADVSELFDPRIEWIIINDCPENCCPPDLRANLEKRGVKLIFPKFNSGRSNARNLGTAAARSVWIEHIDGDDLPLPINVEGLPDPEQFEILQFLIAEVTTPVYELKSFEMTYNARPAGGDWATFTGHLAPFEVRPAATMWKRTFLEGLGGYDARFETVEDVQLALKASASRARVWRGSHPKQVYYRRPGRDSFPRWRVEGMLRVCRWARANSIPRAESEAALWEAKEVLYMASHAAIDVLRNLQPIARYCLWRVGL
jgi:glycosyltransferase involved in cell wall biosynthesis